MINTLLQPNFGIYIAGNATSLIGTWMHRIASGWLVWEMTGSAAWLGAIAFADLFPAVLIAPFAGVAADRWERLPVMKLAQLLGALIACLLAVLFFTGNLTIWVLLAITLLLGSVDSFVQPFRLALVSALVAREDLTSAVALKSITFNLARFVGPAFAGVVIMTAGVGWAFVINAFSFLALLVALQFVRVLQPQVRKRSREVSVLRDALEGARYAMRAPGVGLVLLLLAATCFTGRPVVELLPGWAGEIFAGTATDLAALTSAIGIGAVIGGLRLAGRPSAKGLVKAFLICCFGLAGSVLAFAVSPSTIVALPLMVVAGFFLVSSAICAQTMVQLNVADEMRGRVLSLYAVILRGGPAIGALLMGFAAEFVGLRAPQIFGMVLLFLATLAMLSRRREMEAALEGAE